MPMPYSDHAALLKATAQHGRRETAVLCCGLEKNCIVGAWHGKCESDTAALCKSNGKDVLNPYGKAWQGTDMGAAWERHPMCEWALSVLVFAHTQYNVGCIRVQI